MRRIAKPAERGTGRETRKGLLGLFARRVAGMEMASLARNLRESMPCSAPIARAHSRFAGGHGIMNFSDVHAI